MARGSPSRLSLRTRVLMLTALAMVGMIAVVYLFSSAIILTSFGRLEGQLALRDAKRASLAIGQRLEDLGTKLGDWSQWDDAHDFVETLSPKFVKSNVNPEALALMGLSAVVFVHPQRGVVHSLAIDGEGKAAAVSPMLLAACRPGSPLATHESVESKACGIFQDGGRLMMVVSRPILRSDGSGPLRGALIFAAEVDDELLSRVTQLVQVPVEVWPSDSESLPRDVRYVRERFAQQPGPLALSPTESTIAGYFALTDVTGKPAAIARVRSARSILAYGRACVHYFLFVLIVVGVLVALLLRGMLGPLVLDRVYRLRDAIQGISQTRDLRRTVEVEGEDEIGDLARAMNAMVKDLAEAQNELDVARTKAESASEAKGRFLANMSHEIRTPLNGVLGFSKLLIDDRAADEGERQDWARTIHSSSQHLLALINDILDFSKIDAGRMTLERMPCSMRQMIGDVVRGHQARAAEKGLQLTARFDGPMPATIETDPTRLRQVIENLVTNAIKFTRVGAVQIVARMAARGGDARIRIEVRDSGCGIPTEKLGSIFDPFTQADNSVTRQYGGTGLGLAISRQIAQALSGELTVLSDVGHGSTFAIEFPAGDLAGATMDDGSPEIGAPLARSANASSVRAARLSAKVLLVEDGETNRKLISLVLQRAGATVVTAENGRRGVELATQERFDVVLMDMQMPVMDGYVATATLRRRNLDTPIIALTAHALKGDEERCMAVGCSGFLSKPVEPGLLIQTIADAIGLSAGVASPSGALLAPPATTGEAEMPRESEAPASSAAEAVRSALPMEDAEFREVVIEFVDRLAEQIGAMEAAHEQQAWDELAKLAHWLKGAGGTAGFQEFTAPAAELERQALAGEVARTRVALGTVASIAARIELPAEEATERRSDEATEGEAVGARRASECVRRATKRRREPRSEHDALASVSIARVGSRTH